MPKSDPEVRGGAEGTRFAATTRMTRGRTKVCQCGPAPNARSSVVFDRPARTASRHVETGTAGLRGSSPFVPVVQPTDLAELDYVAHIGRMHRSRNRAVLVQRQVGS